MHHNRIVFLLSVLLLVIVAVLMTVPGVSPFLRVLFSIPLVLYLPGYLLSKILFPGQTLEKISRFSLSIGFSLIILIIGGFILNWTPRGITPNTWMVWIGGIIIGFNVINYSIQRREDSKIDQQVPTVRFFSPQFLWFILTIALTIGAIKIARDGAREQLKTNFTEFWGLPVEDSGHEAIRIGINNDEQMSGIYTIKIFSGDILIKELKSIRIYKDKSWEGTIILPKSNTSRVVEAELYCLGYPDHPCRKIKIWFSGQSND